MGRGTEGVRERRRGEGGRWEGVEEGERMGR